MAGRADSSPQLVGRLVEKAILRAIEDESTPLRVPVGPTPD